MRDRFPYATVSLTEKVCAANWQRHKRIQEMLSFEPILDYTIETPAPDPSKCTFHDSGLGSSIQSEFHTQAQPKAARSMASFRSFMSYEGGAARLLPMPPTILNGGSFYCDICRPSIKDAENEYQWERHVYADLRPYVCIIEGCDVDSMHFASRAEFAHHLTGHQYMQIWICTKCGLKGETRQLVQDYILRTHDSMSEEGYNTKVSEMKVLRDLSSQQCPFCSKIPGRSSFVRHICHHLKELSLSALPQDDPEDDSKESLSDLNLSFSHSDPQLLNSTITHSSFHLEELSAPLQGDLDIDEFLLDIHVTNGDGYEIDY
ncbi:MAG: hypothetical protein M1813_008374 [Trichoglossum hirsutum]|nr:MAG: hypothetical protein M1813_008374 [Trichoglossum hirsutum]